MMTIPCALRGFGGAGILAAMSITSPDDRLTEYNPVVPTTEFPAQFPVFDNDDIAVFVDGVERDDFAVTATYSEGISNDAKAVFAVGVTGKVRVVGARAPHRTNRFGNGGPLPIRDMNLALDTLEGEMQEHARDIGRAIKVPFGEDGPALLATTPGSFLAVNPDGDIIGTNPPSGTGDMNTAVYDPGGIGGDSFDRFYHHGLDNFSMPLAMADLELYVSLTGTDTISGPMHGRLGNPPFRTYDAALNFAKKNYRFTGRLSAVKLLFGPGDWGFFSLGSNLDQAQDYFPFTIYVTAADPGTPANWPTFTGITNGGFNAQVLYATKVKSGYFTAIRRNTTIINDVKIKNSSVPYCLYAGIGGQIYAFGNCEITEPCSFSSAFIYAQQRGAVSLENGDTPAIFPLFNIINPGNVTSPHKYRCVLGSYVYAASAVYPQLTYASKYWVDSTSYSTQTQSGTNAELARNDAPGGPVVRKTGNAGAGTEVYADGKVREWGTITVTNTPVGANNSAGTITLTNTLDSASSHIRMTTNNPYVYPSTLSGQTATSCPIAVLNMHPSAQQSATIRWEVEGYLG